MTYKNYINNKLIIKLKKKKTYFQIESLKSIK